MSILTTSSSEPRTDELPVEPEPEPEPEILLAARQHFYKQLALRTRQQLRTSRKVTG